MRSYGGQSRGCIWYFETPSPNLLPNTAVQPYLAYYDRRLASHYGGPIYWCSPIEDLFLNPAVKKAIILLLYRTFVKVLKDALAHLGPY